ncbi:MULTISPECIES: hypothetical protein [Rhizobium]|uniref:hypothetical protein n=1 Tax=Rhizobium TaxID=379 RepID=UPI000BE8112A|nr:MULTISPECIES: hypothetical protein [Rhizobium]MBB4169308.1 deoxycytidine triphosphate deaminase [Rhizobium sp. BK538]PDS46718.1 hypothetical protein CO668_01580 [Rhizobium anhuiense]
MSGEGDEASVEQCLLTNEAADQLARDNDGKPDALKAKKIPPSLLSAEHIKDYVLATGLISPFYFGGEKPRLKKASYEGRVGKVVYTFEDGKIKSVPFKDGMLKIKANSIVFVECDLNFRLPEYIALRFNLQIKHVHRGLLLGTGPIVDPGFWGKLCIPLHNLTSEDYYISENEGLIWVEFTKTTSTVSKSTAVGVRPSTSGFWDIKKFILKAVESNGDGKLIEIQSSINRVVLDAENQAAEAKTIASRSEGIADKANGRVNRIAWGAGIVGSISVLAIAVGLATLVVNQQSFYDSQHQIYKDYVDEAASRIDNFNKKAESLGEVSTDIQMKLSKYAAIEQRLSELQRKMESLESENEALRQSVAKINSSSK